MALLTTIALTIGGAFVKHVAAGYIGDGAKSQVTQDLLDLVRDQLGDRLTTRPDQPQIDQIAQQVVQKLLPLFAQESRTFDAATREAITLAVVQTLADTDLDADLLLHQRLDPVRLANSLSEKQPTISIDFSPDEATLYRRLLTESCRQLVYIANHFAGYEILVDRRLLTGQDALLEQLARLLAEPDERSRAYADAYRTQLSKQLNKFEQIGIDYAERAASRQQLDVAYVALRLMQGDGSTFDEPRSHRTLRYQRDDGFEPERSRRTVGSIQEMLAYAPRLVIQGQPGSGKSTLLRWLAIQIAQRTLSQNHPALGSWDDCIPFYIQLRAFVNKPLPTPTEWPTHQVRQLALKAPDTWMHEVLTDGRAVVLIDGADETPEAQRADLLQWLQELITTYPWARYIITSRPAAIKLWPAWLDWSRAAGFLTLSLQEMELEQSFHFIDQWHVALQPNLTDATQQDEVAALAEPLKQLVRQRDALRRLARNPLLCSIICALHREHPHAMPQNRIKLYQGCVEMLMHRRDAERKVGSLADYPSLSNIHEEVVLSNYAYHLMRNGESEEGIKEADHYFDQLIQIMNMPGWNGERLRHYFVVRTGLLVEPAEERIAFTHRTFQEFLAAQKIIEENDIGMLIDKAGDDQWRETILLTIGIKGIRPVQSDRLLNGLLNKVGELDTRRYRHEIYLLAVACLETAIYLTPQIREHILEKAATLIPPRDDDAIIQIAKGGDPMVDLLQFNPKHSFSQMSRCVRALIAIGSEHAIESIEQYATAPQYEEGNAIALRHSIGTGISVFAPKYYCERVFKHVRMLDFSNTQISNTELQYIQSLLQLHTLDLSNTQISNEGLQHLKLLTDLRFLSLRDTRITDAGMVYIDHLAFLKILHLGGTQISGDGLIHLQRLGSLRQLTLMRTPVSNKGLAHLQNIPSLQRLFIWETQINDEGLPLIQNISSLQSLHIGSTQVSDAGMIHLQGIPSLQSLYLNNTKVTDEGLLHIGKVSNLQSLYLWETQVSNVGLSNLQSLGRLRMLDLRKTQVSDTGLAHLQGFTSLQNLDLSDTQVSDAGLIYLQSLTSLQELDLNNTQVSDAGLIYLQSLTSLQDLHLNNTQVSDAGLVYLKNLTSLQTLNLRNTQVSDKGLAHLQTLTKLQRLDLSGTQVSNVGLSYLQSLPSLKTLYLRNTRVKDAGDLEQQSGFDIYK